MRSPSILRLHSAGGLTTGLLLAWLLAAGCSRSEGHTSAAAAQEGSGTEAAGLDGGQLAKEIRDLVSAVTPFDPALPPGEQNQWHRRRTDTLERMRSAGPDIGRAALDEYHNRSQDLVEIRSGLLEIAAYNLPEETRELLSELTTTYGPDLALRTKACQFLGATSPETAVELLGPILLDTGRTRTYPPDDKMLKAWLTAARAVDHDPSELLATIVADLHQSQEVRHPAAKALADHPSPRGIAALETAIVESTGNNYLRRIAAQSLVKCLERDELCAKLREIGEKESDIGFQVFLADMLDKNCR